MGGGLLARFILRVAVAVAKVNLHHNPLRKSQYQLLGAADVIVDMDTIV
jgi:hypothetical protein